MTPEFDHLLEAWWAGELDAEGLARLEALAASDPALAEIWRSERQLTGLLAARGSEHAPAGLAAAVLARIEAESSVDRSVVVVDPQSSAGPASDSPKSAKGGRGVRKLWGIPVVRMAVAASIACIVIIQAVRIGDEDLGGSRGRSAGLKQLAPAASDLAPSLESELTPQRRVFGGGAETSGELAGVAVDEAIQPASVQLGLDVEFQSGFVDDRDRVDIGRYYAEPPATSEPLMDAEGRSFPEPPIGSVRGSSESVMDLAEKPSFGSRGLGGQTPRQAISNRTPDAAENAIENLQKESILEIAENLDVSASDASDVDGDSDIGSNIAARPSSVDTSAAPIDKAAGIDSRNGTMGENRRAQISGPPSPIVGDLSGAEGTEEGRFVFEDALNLNDFVSDGFASEGTVLWAYEVDGQNWATNSVYPLMIPTSGGERSRRISTASEFGNERGDDLSSPPTENSGVVDGNLAFFYASNPTTAPLDIYIQQIKTPESAQSGRAAAIRSSGIVDAEELSQLVVTNGGSISPPLRTVYRQSRAVQLNGQLSLNQVSAVTDDLQKRGVQLDWSRISTLAGDDLGILDAPSSSTAPLQVPIQQSLSLDNNLFFARQVFDIHRGEAEILMQATMRNRSGVRIENADQPVPVRFYLEVPSDDAWSFVE